MNIVEATRKSVETEKWICRTSFPYFIFKPSNTAWCCTVYCSDSVKGPAAMWNPTAEDLMAEDWEITDSNPENTLC